MSRHLLSISDLGADGIEEVLALRPGSVVEFGVPAENGVSVFIEDRLVARARPGRHGGRRAVRIETKDVNRRRQR